MSNMSYCRFQNTDKDLDDCKDALEELILNGSGALSKEELRAAQSLVATCIDIVMMVAEARHLDTEEFLDGDTDKQIKAVLDEAQRNAQDNDPRDDRI
jgi:hypothetical protein